MPRRAQRLGQGVELSGLSSVTMMRRPWSGAVRGSHVDPWTRQETHRERQVDIQSKLRDWLPGCPWPCSVRLDCNNCSEVDEPGQPFYRERPTCGGRGYARRRVEEGLEQFDERTRKRRPRPKRKMKRPKT